MRLTPLNGGWRYCAIFRTRPRTRALPLNIIGEGVVTRTVRDTAAFVSAAERYHRNPRLAPVGHVTGPAQRQLRVGLVLDSPTGAVLDEATDRVGRPSRPLPRGLVTVRELRGLAIVAALAGLVLAATVGIATLGCYLLALAQVWVLGRGLGRRLAPHASVGDALGHSLIVPTMLEPDRVVASLDGVRGLVSYTLSESGYRVTEASGGERGPWGDIEEPVKELQWSTHRLHALGALALGASAGTLVASILGSFLANNSSFDLSGVLAATIAEGNYDKLLVLGDVQYENGALVQSSYQILLQGIAKNRYHNGGRLRYGPVDGKLYVSVGDAQNPNSNPQNNNSLNGKILRINLDGSIPSDNPFGNAVWSKGHRNPQGLAWQPGTGPSRVGGRRSVGRQGAS